jgi:hypothetical protein
VNFAAITLCVASQPVFVVVIVVYFIINSVQKLLGIPLYVSLETHSLLKSVMLQKNFNMN